MPEYNSLDTSSYLCTGIVTIPHLPFLGSDQSRSGGSMAVPDLDLVMIGSRIGMTV